MSLPIVRSNKNKRKNVENFDDMWYLTKIVQNLEKKNWFILLLILIYVFLNK